MQVRMIEGINTHNEIIRQIRGYNKKQEGHYIMIKWLIQERILYSLIDTYQCRRT